MKQFLVLLILATVAALSANAATIDFGGLTWTTYGDGTFTDNGDGTITITQNSNTEVGIFINSGSTYASVSYEDNPNANIDMFQQNLSNGLNPRTQNGSLFGASLLGYERYSNAPAIETFVFFDLTPRVAGTPHTVETLLHGDGSVDHWYDNTYAAGTFLRDNVGAFGAWEQTLLRVRSNGQTRLNSVTFTQYLFGDERPGEVPEPGTYVLMGAGLGGLLFLHRRRRNNKL